MFIIAGLGNPEKKYEGTRHNAGFVVIDAIARQYNIEMGVHKFRAICGKGTIDGQRVLLMKPQTYMNLSGESVGAAVDFFHADPASEILIVCDDVNLSAGQLRIRRKGSAGGHNGLRNIIAHLGTQEFMRLRLGVGAAPEHGDMVSHVLGRIRGEDKEQFDEGAALAVRAAAMIAAGSLEEAMNEFNRSRRSPAP